MTSDPALRALADVNPERPAGLAGEAHADWAVAERERILATSPDVGSGGRRRPRHVLGGLLTAGALAGLAALSVAFWLGGDSDAPPAPADAAAISVLERPRVDADAIPAWTLTHRNLRSANVIVATGRRAAVVGGRSLFVARTSGGGVCLIDAVADPSTAPANPGGLNCQPRVVLDSAFLVSKLSGGSGRRGITVIGVAPDGFAQVTSGGMSAPITDNVFVLSGVRTTDPVVIMGPAGRRVETVAPFANPATTTNRQGAPTYLPVAMATPDTRAGARSVVVGDDRYDVTPRTPPGDVAIAIRPARVDRTARGRENGMVTVPWPTHDAPLSLTTSLTVTAARTGSVRVIGLAPDGYDRVVIGPRSAAIHGNLIALDDIPLTPRDGVLEAVVSGPAGTLRGPVAVIPGQPRVPLRPSPAP